MRRLCDRRRHFIGTLVSAALGASWLAARSSAAAESDTAGEPSDAGLPRREKGVAEDVVETIVPDGESPPSATVAPARVAPEGNPPRPTDRTQVTGWARESIELTLPAGGFRQGAPNPLDVPRDRLISRTQMHIRASHVRGGWFEATVSGVLGYSLREEGPASDAAFNGANGQETIGDTQIELRELYFGFYSKRVDFRIGQQRVAWGRADLQSPNDVLNARDLRDPVLTEAELRHIPTPLARLDVDLGGVGLELVGTPVFIPDTYDVFGTNWSAIQDGAPGPIKSLFAAVSPLIDPTKQNQYNALVHDTQLPAANFAAPSGGAKLSTTVAGADLDLYYHYGFDTTPFLSVSPPFAAFLGTLNFHTFRPSDLTPVLQELDTGIQPFSAIYVRRHHIGFDAATPAGPFVLRLDAAYDSQRVFYQAKFTSFSSPTAQGVLSVEYQTADVDKVILVEATYTRIADPLGAQLLGYDADSYGVSGTFRWPLGASGLALDLRGLVGIEPVSFILQPALRWKLSDSFSLKAGAVLLGGEEESLGWYYRRNTSAFAQAKYAF